MQRVLSLPSRAPLAVGILAHLQLVLQQQVQPLAQVQAVQAPAQQALLLLGKREQQLRLPRVT